MGSSARAAPAASVVIKPVATISPRMAIPPAHGAGGIYSRSACPSQTLTRDRLAERHPALAVEALQPHLLDREEILRAGVDPDPILQQRQRQVEAGRLAH